MAVALRAAIHRTRNVMADFDHALARLTLDARDDEAVGTVDAEARLLESLPALADELERVASDLRRAAAMGLDARELVTTQHGITARDR